MALSARCAVVARNAMRTTGVRRMSSNVSQAEAISTFQLWKKIGLGCTAAVSLYIGATIVAELGHEEHHHAINYQHLKIRNKPLPWKASNCDLFDMECRDKAAEERE